MALREDFLPELEGLRERFTGLALNRMRLQAMSGEAALAVVRQSPELVDEAVAEHIIRFVAAKTGAEKTTQMEIDPAILSVVCYELNNQRREHRTTRITRELLEGTKEEVLGNFCDSAFEGLPAEVRHFVEDELLTATGHQGQFAPRRTPCSFREFRQEAIDKLVGRRLIRRDEQRGVARLELAHDRLAEARPFNPTAKNGTIAEAFERERSAARAAQANEERQGDSRLAPQPAATTNYGGGRDSRHCPERRPASLADIGCFRTQLRRPGKPSKNFLRSDLARSLRSHLDAARWRR